jgi:hypothetical protein
MDGSFTIRPSPGVPRSYAGRDPVTVREAVATDLGTTKAVAAAGDHGAAQRDPRQDARQESRQEAHQESRQDARHDHAPADVVVDAASREVINRANDVRTHAAAREHPDQALLRLRAYRPAREDAEPPSAADSHANIKA